MRARRNLLADRVAASAAAVLLLSGAAGCSGSTQKPAVIGGGSSSASGASSTPPTAPTTATSAAPSPTTSSEPAFKLPADYALNIDPDTTGDPVKDAILADNARFFKAVLEAMASGNAKDPLLLTYLAPGAAAYYWQGGITAERAKGLTVTGTDHLYKRTVDIKGPAQADVSVCEDQGKAFDKEIATGKVHVTPVTDNSYVLYFFGVQKASNGIWQVVYTQTHRNDQAVKQECR
jgi:hypothetical protein